MAESTIITTNLVRWKGRIFILALLLALAVEIFLLMSDFSFFRPVDTASDLAPIAELVNRFKSVKGQLPGELAWDNAKTGQTLYRRQFLMTLDQAKAEIAFLDGSGLVLDENTLIQLEKSPANESRTYRKLVVRLLHGTIHRRKARTPKSRAPVIEIDIGKTVSTLAPDSEVTISANPEGPIAAEIEVHSGEIRLSGKNGGLAVKKGEEAQIPRASPGMPVSRRMNFDLRVPSSSETLDVDGELAPILFSWSMDRSVSSGNPVELEVSRDPDFQSGKAQIFKKRIPASEPPLDKVETRLELPVFPASTKWYWRISVSPELQSQVKSFRLRPRPSPNLRFPGNGAKASPGTTIDFSWSAIDGASGYELEVIPAVGTLAEKRSVSASEPSARVDRLVKGTFTWRARALFRNHDPGAWSEPRNLSVGAVVPAPPPPPQLLQPEIKPKPRHSFFRKPGLFEKVVAVVFGITEAHAEEPDPSSPQMSWTILLKWRPVPGVKRYRVQVGRERSFRHVLGEHDTSSPKWSWTYRIGMKHHQGRLFYRVASIGEDGQVGAFSSPLPFKIPRAVLKAEASVKARKTRKTAPPRPLAAPVPELAEVRTVPTTFWKWNFLMNAGMGNFTEGSGDPTLNSISSKTFYPQAATRVFALVTNKKDPDHPSHWAIQLEASASEFTQSSGRAALSLNLVEWTGKFDVLHFRSEPFSLGRWRVALGGRAERDFRWIKPQVELIDIGYGYSAGPVLLFEREDEFTSVFSPIEKGALFALPFTGILTGWQVAGESSLWAEWKFGRSRAGWIGTRLQGDVSYSIWSTPAGASLLRWAIWFGPSFHFGNGYRPPSL